MKIAYHNPFPDTVYAYRTINKGFELAFTDLGHDFFTLTPNDKLEEFIEHHQIDILITSSHFLYRKYINYDALKKLRQNGLFVLTKIDFWNSPLSSTRLNEAKSMKDDSTVVKLILDGLLGDAYYHVVEQGDGRMEGFKEALGADYHTIPLAADKTLAKNAVYDPQFNADISFIGTNLPDKRKTFERLVFPLKKSYDLKLYGQDWTSIDRFKGLIQKGGQLFNVPYLKSLQKPKLKFEDEAKIYASSKVSINIHEDYQKKFGGDCNERTFKIPLFNGFEICDDIECIRKYFVEGKEIVIAKNDKEWFDKLEYYIKNPDKRLEIIKAGRKKVLESHTYHNRAEQIISIASSRK